MKSLIILMLGLSLSALSCSDPAGQLIVKKSEFSLSQIEILQKEPLSEGEKSALLFIREEEKLARDVYDFLFDKWSSRVFDNISSSEQKHMDAVLVLLNKYDLEDPVSNNPMGVFNNQELQQLYNDLIREGSSSLSNGLRVGAAIEEIDILDLKNELENPIDNEDITIVFENLMKGSRNHLRSFVRNLKNMGIDYDPQYLTPGEFEAIIDSDMERGRN